MATDAAAASSNMTCTAVPSVDLRGELRVKRIVNGLWQTSGGWGPQVSIDAALDAMATMHAKGYTSFDGADHYGPAEDLMGLLRERLVVDHPGGFELTAMTKWCPSPKAISRREAEAAIGKSLRRMKVRALDSLQVHWWDYSMRQEMLDCMHHVDALRREGKVKQIALTNFDTAHVRLFLDEGIPIASNQVCYRGRCDVHRHSRTAQKYTQHSTVRTLRTWFVRFQRLWCAMASSLISCHLLWSTI